jgi:hypothetical protein
MLNAKRIYHVQIMILQLFDGLVKICRSITTASINITFGSKPSVACQYSTGFQDYSTTSD